MLESSALVDYVAVVCTHHPLLIPLKWFSEVFGWTLSRLHCTMDGKKLTKLDHLEELKVVTSFP